jgi:hypothetical protein
MALTDNLIAFWEFEEASNATRNDSHGTNHLTNNNSVAATSGRVGLCAEFYNADADFLNRASNATLQAGDIDFTFAQWVVLRSKANTYSIVGKDDAGAGQREYGIGYNLGIDRYQFYAAKPTDDTVTVEANNYGAPAVETWHFVVCWHDATANTLNIQVNNGTANSSATGGSLQAASNAAFHIGSRATPGGQAYFDGFIDQVGYWKRTLTSDERTWLYNSGSGRSYAEVLAGMGGGPGTKYSWWAWETFGRPLGMNNG